MERRYPWTCGEVQIWMDLLTAFASACHSLMRHLTWPTILALVASMGCTRRTEEPPTPAAFFAENSNRGACALSPVDTTGWQRVRLTKAPMSLLLPPDYERDSVIFVGGSTGWPGPEMFSAPTHGPDIGVSHIGPQGPWPVRLSPSPHWCLLRAGNHTVLFFGGRQTGSPNLKPRFVGQSRWWLNERVWLELGGTAEDSLEFRELLTIIRAARIQQAPGS